MNSRKKILSHLYFFFGELISPLLKPSTAHSSFLEASIRLFTRPVSTGLAFLLLLSNISFSQQLPKVQQAVFKNAAYNISNYGAKADGITLNTKRINAAIDDCNKKGGGSVIIPKGLWLTGPIVLKSNVNLHLAKNAVLQFTSD